MDQSELEDLRVAGDPRYHLIMAKSGRLHRSEHGTDEKIIKAIQENTDKPEGWRVLIERSSRVRSRRADVTLWNQVLDLLVKTNETWSLIQEEYDENDTTVRWDVEASKKRYEK